MISIKSEREIELMREAGRYLQKTFKEIEKHIRVGVTTKELDKVAHDYIIKNNCVPSCLGFEGFPATLCTSINDEVVHGIPSKRKLKNGDIVSCDLVLSYKGYHADATRTYIIGSVDKKTSDLVKNTKEAFMAGVKKVREGTRIKEISKAIEEYAHAHGLSIVEELVGHGIGAEMHEDPDVPNFDDGNNTRLKAGMVIAIEPMLNLGTKEVYLEEDEWTVKTYDGKPSAHYENTVLVTKDGYEILTGED
ncbi:MAG: type I methionyl aminopeptidase [Bacilli bacterium]|nr:type I methionyl aminopeptidase [Bacilli bacterium]